MSEKRTRTRLAELSEEVRSSDGLKIVDRLFVFNRSAKIFLSNNADLENAISVALATNSHLDIRDVAKRKRFDHEMFEILRHLHNTVSAALSLVDHTRNFYTSYYHDKTMIPDFQAEVRARFAEDGLSQFVKCLRQFCQHYRMPSVGASMCFNQDGSFTQSVELPKSDLLEFRSWNSHAKVFIENQPERIEIRIIMIEYSNNVMQFHDWFVRKLLEIHRVELSHYNKCMDEIESIKSEDPLYKNYRPN